VRLARQRELCGTAGVLRVGGRLKNPANGLRRFRRSDDGVIRRTCPAERGEWPEGSRLVTRRPDAGRQTPWLGRRAVDLVDHRKRLVGPRGGSGIHDQNAVDACGYRDIAAAADEHEHAAADWQYVQLRTLRNERRRNEKQCGGYSGFHFISSFSR